MKIDVTKFVFIYYSISSFDLTSIAKIDYKKLPKLNILNGVGQELSLASHSILTEIK